MITFRSGMLTGQQVDGPRGDVPFVPRPTELTLLWPQWDVVGGISISATNRYHSAKIAQGSYTQGLASDESQLNIPLMFKPYLRPGTPVHWLFEVQRVLALRGKWIDFAWGVDGMGEWFVHSATSNFGEFGINPGTNEVNPGLYPREIEVQLGLVADAPKLIPSLLAVDASGNGSTGEIGI